MLITGIVISSLLGLAGGVVGTYFSIRNTRGRKERSFMIKVAIILWCGVTAFIVLWLVLPNPYRWFLWIPYGILLPITIFGINRRQAEIRQKEEQ